MIQIGSDSDFQLAGTFLRENYTEALLTSELGVRSVFDFQKRKDGKRVRHVLARLFFAGAPVPGKEVLAGIPEPVVNAMLSLGILESSGESEYRCSILLYPVDGMLIGSDRLATIDSLQNPENVPRDFVYLALTSRTQSFLQMLPQTECDSLLDMGAGSGVAALLASRHARQCWATDISARSTLFATFNAKLNGVTNVHCLEGSLYDPVAGLTFDRIVTHPPYDPMLSQGWSFCDGGYDGEVVVRGAIQGLPQYLRPGGQFYAQARVGDRKGRPIEERIREWLGGDHRQFDVVIVVRDMVQPEEYAFGSVMTMSKRMEDYDAYMQRFKEIEVEQLVYCNMLIERRAGNDASEPLTLRRLLGVRATAAEMEWLLQSQRSLPGLGLEGCRPVMSPTMQLHVRHGCEGGELRPLEYVIATTEPFHEEIPCPTWIARLVAACNGKHTTEEIYAQMKKVGPIQPHEFEAALKRLIAIGAIRSDAQRAGAFV
jgi:SAM-dependent methyltransferase